jgi:hypothetical protein
MNLHGSLEENLRAAVRSARRLRGHHVHADTLKHWGDLLQFARRDRPPGYPQQGHVLGRLIVDLETEISKRLV